MNTYFPGSNVAIVTPFTAGGAQIDYDVYRELLDRQLAAGTDGIVPAGCTGEAATLSHDEQKAIIKFTVEHVAGRARVIAGTGSNNTVEAVMLTRYAKEVGADGALIITPYYNKPTPEGQFLHFKKIADEVAIPIMLYNVPGRTGVKMLPATIARLRRETGNIVSIKEACGSVEQVCDIRALSDIEILSGDDSLTAPMMAVGASGVVSVVANLIPERIKALCVAAGAGDFATAQKIHYENWALMKAMFIETNPICVKTALSLLGKVAFSTRLPLCPATAATTEALREILAGAGLA
ncbi:4-hydroxy-tetrahydrodipicolinate synthase [Planctomycetales bacterium]|nr:4-hydroxy-tetrahydrodipicolinate synthase [Planctomycetales bacterium]GHT06763.1 4-hydroxy-tetrahydrodipicolinate synthase [Planctomycetales bacterium]